jgi:hypothetical protein
MDRTLEKWADYLISAVRYNSDSSKRIISHFKVHVDNGDSIGESRTWTKEEVLMAFSTGHNFSAIIKDSNGKWKKGADISISRFDDSFFRTDLKDIPGDYLEEVTEF